MDFNAINQMLSSSATSVGSQLESTMQGDMTDPANWVRAQQQVAQYTNLLNGQSAIISDVKTLISSITSKM